MQETIITILDYITKWITAYIAVCGVIAVVGLGIFIVIVAMEHNGKSK